MSLMADQNTILFLDFLFTTLFTSMCSSQPCLSVSVSRLCCCFVAYNNKGKEMKTGEG